MSNYSVYDFLSFVLPGGLVMLAYHVFAGEPRPSSIDAGVLVVLTGVAFVIGHGIAAIASWLEPIAWGRRPGTHFDATWSLDTAYSSRELSAIHSSLSARYQVDDTLARLYSLAYTELQQAEKGAFLATLNSQIGFYRNTAMACLISSGLILWAAYQQGATPLAIVGIGGAAGGVLFVWRYRRFNARFGDNVVRGIRVRIALSAKAE